jgi:Mn-dependent DtxR family transcriptional regulator
MKPTYAELERRVQELESRLKLHSATEEQILDRLAESWERDGPPGFMEIPALIEDIGPSPEKTREILENLVADGWVNMDESAFSAHLTPEGYSRARPTP